MKCANDIKLGAGVTTSKDKEIIEMRQKRLKLLTENYYMKITFLGWIIWKMSTGSLKSQSLVCCSHLGTQEGKEGNSESGSNLDTNIACYVNAFSLKKKKKTERVPTLKIYI